MRKCNELLPLLGPSDEMLVSIECKYVVKARA